MCPICHSKMTEFEMHEAIVTRGDVDYAPFEKRVQIFVPQNCVLLCPGECHIKAQNYERGKRICARHLLRWNGDTVAQWLGYLMGVGLTAADEAMRNLRTWRLLPFSLS